MVSRIAFFAVLLIFVGCSKQNNFPTPLSEKVNLNSVELTTVLPTFNPNSSVSEVKGIDELNLFEEQYLERSNTFSLDKFQKRWHEVNRGLDIENTDKSDLQQWFQITGLLFELTGDADFATEMERLTLLGAVEKDQVESYVFTKNLDNLFTNLFIPSIIEYKHTTGGEVKIEMLTDYPKSGKVELKFNMTERRYIEVNIRIPDWAEGATITVKRVKYFAAPGSYCKIAKKWKEGDVVEIEFPADKIPKSLKTAL